MTIQLTQETAEDVQIITERTGDPAALANNGKLYTKDMAAITQLFYRASDGTISQLTPVSTGDTPWLRTGTDVRLDQAGDTEVTPFDDNSTTLGLNTTVALSRRWLGVITGSNGLSTFSAAGDAQRSSSFGSSGLTWGAGGATPADTKMERIGVARIALSNPDTAAAAGLFPIVAASATGIIGDVTLPWFSITTTTRGLTAYATAGDANPLARYQGSGIALGPGGGGALDVGLRRSTLGVLAVSDGAGGGAVSLIPNTDNATLLGTTANRWSGATVTGAAAVASGFRAFDTGPNPTAQVSGDNAAGGFVALGDGATTDVKMQRTAATEMTISDGGAAGIDVIPPADLQGKLGLSVQAGDAVNRRWLKVTAQTITSGDICFTDAGCPVCGQEFQEGDDIVLRVIKAQRTASGPLTTTVPCHHGCK